MLNFSKKFPFLYVNDLVRPQTQISRSDHSSLTLNISEMAKDTAIVTMEGE